MKKALITGVNGQDGSYLCELLLSKGYEVHGTKRRSSTVTTGRISHLLDSTQGVDVGGRIILHHADVTDSSSINRIIDNIEPNEIYNLAAQSHVAVSFDEPEYTANSDALGVLRCLEAIRRRNSGIKFYQASTSELFGGQETTSYSELSPLNPRSPYAAAKAYAYYIVKQYRDAYGIFAVNGILFNHESPRRGENFVTRKITLGIARILEGCQNKILLGNLSAKRDWGHARDYAEAMWMILQCDHPKDYVIATGESYSIREFLTLAFSIVGVKIVFEGSGLLERGIVAEIDHNILSKYTSRKIEVGCELVALNESYFRPLEVDHLVGDSSRARKELGWAPKTTFTALVEEMVLSDISAKHKS
jgi:GDPmannose 4,6-dehydratase